MTFFFLFALQSHHISIVGSVFHREDKRALPVAAEAVELAIVLFDSGFPLTMEESLLAISRVVSAAEERTVEFVEPVFARVLAALDQRHNKDLFLRGVNVVGDLCFALDDISAMAASIMDRLRAALQDADTHRLVKSAALAAIGDVALNMGSEFHPWLPEVFTTLTTAQGITATEGDEDMEEWVEGLRHNVLDVYSAILQGANEENGGKALAVVHPNLPNMAKFLGELAQLMEGKAAEDLDPELLRKMANLLGDMAQIFGPEMISTLVNADMQWVQSVCTWQDNLQRKVWSETGEGEYEEDGSPKETAGQWAMRMLRGE